MTTPEFATKIREALASYKRGDRPYPFRSPRSWYIVFKGQLYPLKYIYSMAIGHRPGSFNTAEAIAKLEAHDFHTRWRPADPHEQFERHVRKSLLSTSKARLERIARAKRKPLKVLKEIEVFERNPDVVAEVLFQAKGVCGKCGERAPFRRRRDGSPYLEVHHLTPLARGGDDHISNAIALCPNCHRFAHHG